jgi:hypothetical protein
LSNKDTPSTPLNLKNQPTMIAIFGLILVALGAMIVAIPGFPFRGSGLGTILIVLGAIVIIGGFVRFNQKPK